MPAIKHIAIPEPCHANKEHMTPSERGSMCSLCQKEVIDFRGNTSREVIGYLDKNPNTCGRFWKGQIDWVNSNIRQPKRKVPYSFSNNKALFLASLAAMVFVPVGMSGRDSFNRPVLVEDTFAIVTDSVRDDKLEKQVYYNYPESDCDVVDGFVVVGDIHTEEVDDTPKFQNPWLWWLSDSLKKTAFSNGLPSYWYFWRRFQAILRSGKKDDDE